MLQGESQTIGLLSIQIDKYETDNIQEKNKGKKLKKNDEIKREKGFIGKTG